MPNYDFENIVGQIMPNAFISQVKLESAGGGLLPERDNPHIHSIDTNTFLATSESMLEVQPRSLRVTIIANLKDIAKKGATNQWFRNNKFTDYLSCVIMCSTDKSLTEYILRKDDQGDRGHLVGKSVDFEAGELDSHWGRPLAFAPQVKNALNIGIGGGPGTGQLIDKHLKVAKFNMRDLEDPYVQTDDQGREIYNFPLQVSFDGPGMESNNPRHLTVFAYTFFEIDKYFASLNLAGQVLNSLKDLSRMSVGSLSVQNIIENFNIVEDSFIFRRQDNGQVYFGPYHKMQDGRYMAGSMHGEGAPILIAEKVPNSTVQDFRNFEELAPNLVDLSSYEKELYPSQDRFFNEYVKSNIQNTSVDFFSDIWLTRGVTGACRFAFSVDLGRIIKSKTKYSWLLDKQPQLINSNFKILSFKILRKRVNIGSDSKIIPFEGGDYAKSIGASFDTESIYDLPEVILETYQDENAHLVEVDGVNSFREANVFLENSPGLLDARTYCVSDGSISNVNVGVYQYGVEIEVQDLLVDFIEIKINELLELKSFLLAYQARSNNASMNTYDLKINRFTENFINAELQLNTVNNLVPLFNKLGDVLALLEPSSGYPTDIRRYIASMLLSTVPETGSPDGIESALTFVNELATELAKLIGTKPVNKDTVIGTTLPVFGARAGQASSDPNPKSFKIFHYFHNDFFDASIAKNTGYDFLSTLGQDAALVRSLGEPGLRTIDTNIFRQRVTQESNKYILEDSNVDASVANFPKLSIGETERYRFLSPSRVFLDGEEESVNLLELGVPITEEQENYNFNKFVSFLAQLANFKSPSGQPYVEISRKNDDLNSIRDNLIEVLADKSCTIEDPSVVLRQVQKNNLPNIGDTFGLDSAVVQEISNITQEEEYSSSDIVGIHTTQDTDIYNPTEVFVSLLSGIIMENNDFSRLQQDPDEAIERLKLKNFDIIGNEAAANRARTPSAVDVPYQIKTLMLSSTALVREQLRYSILDFNKDLLNDPKKSISYYLNFFKLIKMEYVHGFSGDIRQAIWRPLTSEVLDNAASDLKELLIRATPYSDDLFYIKQIPGLELVNFDSYFIIRPAEGPEILRTGALPYPTFLFDEDVKRSYIPEATYTDPRVLNQIDAVSGGSTLMSGVQSNSVNLNSDEPQVVQNRKRRGLSRRNRRGTY